MLPELKDITIQTRFEVRKGDEFISDVAIKFILSSKICYRISSEFTTEFKSSSLNSNTCNDAHTHTKYF